MRPGFWRLVPVTLIAMAIAIAASAGAGPESKAIPWQSDFKKAQALAAKQKKIIMIDFYADW